MLVQIYPADMGKVHAAATGGCNAVGHCYLPATKSRKELQEKGFRRPLFFGAVRLQRPNPLLYRFQFPLTCVRSQE